MTEQEKLDRLLRHALAEALERDWADTLSAAPAEAVLSPRQQRRMTSMLADPLGYARRRGRPLWRRVLRAAACLLLVSALTLGALMAVSPTVRAAVLRWVTEVYETQIVYRFHGETPDSPLPRYAIGALPEGYVDTGEFEQAGASAYRIYENNQGQRLFLEYGWIRQGSAVVVSTIDMTVKDVSINGCPGYLYLSQDPEQGSAVVWMDEEAQVNFLIDGYESESVLLHMAENVILEETTK